MPLPILRRLTLLLVLVLGAGTLAAPAHAQDGALTYAPTGAPYDRAISVARDSVEALMAEQRIPGLTAAVLVDGQIVWSEGFGWADVESQVPVTPLTKMRIGSVSKSMTGAALGVLLDRGQINLDAPVQQYVPSFPEKRAPISTRQVAGHIAGIRHYRGDEFLIDENYDSVEEGLSIFEEDSLLFEPGAQFQYSSYGWNLVSAVVEGASGQAFLPFMRASVFRPLSLRHTVADHTDSLITYRTRFYSVEDGVLINAPYVDNSYKWAGGGFLSTAEDLVRFGDAMISGDFFTPQTRTGTAPSATAAARWAVRRSSSCIRSRTWSWRSSLTGAASTTAPSTGTSLRCSWSSLRQVAGRFSTSAEEGSGLPLSSSEPGSACSMKGARRINSRERLHFKSGLRMGTRYEVAQRAGPETVALRRQDEARFDFATFINWT